MLNAEEILDLKLSKGWWLGNCRIAGIFVWKYSNASTQYYVSWYFGGEFDSDVSLDCYSLKQGTSSRLPEYLENSTLFCKLTTQQLDFFLTTDNEHLYQWTISEKKIAEEN